MRNLTLSLCAALMLTGCVQESEEDMTPPTQPELVTYNLIIPYSPSNDPDKTSLVAIKARLCRPLYYDQRLIRVNCFKEGDWIWKNGNWKYVGAKLVFDGVVKAYYQVEPES